MSINASINGDDHDTRTPLVDNLMRFDTLSEKISENIETVKDYIEVLTEYREKMGTVEDTRSMRRRMNNEISEGNDLIKRILDDFRDLEDLKFKRRKDIENFNKMVRRLNNSFDDQYQKFTKVLKEIHSREKIFLELRKSTTLNPSSVADDSSVNTNSYNVNNDDRESVEETTRNLQFYSSIIEERENQLQDVRKLASEMNMLAQAQSKKIHDQVGDLITLVEDTSKAEDETKGANNELSKTLKQQQNTTKKNLVISVVLILLCLVIITIVLSTSSS